MKPRTVVLFAVLAIPVALALGLLLLTAPAALAAGWGHPALLFHGCADDLVPDADSLDFLRAVAFADVELRLLKSGDHRLTVYKEEIAAATGQFFARLLAAGR